MPNSLLERPAQTYPRPTAPDPPNGPILQKSAGLLYEQQHSTPAVPKLAAHPNSGAPPSADLSFVRQLNNTLGPHLILGAPQVKTPDNRVIRVFDQRLNWGAPKFWGRPHRFLWYSGRPETICGAQLDALQTD